MINYKRGAQSCSFVRLFCVLSKIICTFEADLQPKIRTKQ